MAIIRVTKEFQFEAAHALWNYDGKCKHIHGHSYKLFVTVKGSPINDSANPKDGMVIDFSILKSIIKKEIVDQYDHALVLSEMADPKTLSTSPQMFDKIIITKYQPTCENMVADFAELIKGFLPKKIFLHSLKLYETATSYAEWHSEDN